MVPSIEFDVPGALKRVGGDRELLVRIIDFVAEARVAPHQLADGQGCEIIGAQAGERATIAADRCAHVVANEDFCGHGRTVRWVALKSDSAIVASIDQRLL